MDQRRFQSLKTEIINLGRLLWEKDLASGLNGNISTRVDGDVILLTATKTCLGQLNPKDILLMKLDGTILEAGAVSTEKLLHTEIYKNFPDAKAVIHTHTTYTSAYFLEHDCLTPRIFESKVYLGEIKAVEQMTPSVTHSAPVIGALKRNNVAVLKNHGVVAMGENLFDCFVLIQGLEEAVKIEAISRLFKGAQAHKSTTRLSDGQGTQVSIEKFRTTSHERQATSKKYKLFSEEQITEIVRLVNEDSKLQDLGTKTQMNMDLAVQLNETGKVYSFQFQNGRITNVGNNSGAEFLISASEHIWRAVFNQEIDPFVATTQKKMNLRGDFAKISKWYAPCSRIFELWQLVPVE